MCVKQQCCGCALLGLSALELGCVINATYLLICQGEEGVWRLFQGCLILNVLNLKLLTEVPGCFVSMAAESSDQRAVAQCLVLDLPHMPQTRRCL